MIPILVIPAMAITLLSIITNSSLLYGISFGYGIPYIMLFIIWVCKPELPTQQFNGSVKLDK